MRGACAVAGSDEHRVPLRMPGRSAPANGRESTADGNVPCPGRPSAGRIVVMPTPHAAESVARLVLSAMQCADHYFQTAVRNR
jgi:hypothetical protein